MRKNRTIILSLLSSVSVEVMDASGAGPGQLLGGPTAMAVDSFADYLYVAGDWHKGVDLGPAWQHVRDERGRAPRHAMALYRYVGE